MGASGTGITWFLLIISHVAILPTLEATEVSLEMSGIIVPTYPPVDDLGNLNYEIIPRIVQYYADKGVDGLLVVGTEAVSLAVDDRMQMIDYWIESASSLGLCVMVQVGAEPQPDAVYLAEYAEKAGASAILYSPVKFYQVTTAKVLSSLKAIANAASKTPVLYYDSPENTGVNVNIVTLLQLATATMSNFKGICTDNLDTAVVIENKLVDDQAVFITNFNYLASGALGGFKNFIIVKSAVYPEALISIVKNGNAGNLEQTMNEFSRFLKVIFVFVENSKDNVLSALKEAASLVSGIYLGRILPPQIPFSEEDIFTLKRNLQEANIKTYDYDISE